MSSPARLYFQRKIAEQAAGAVASGRAPDRPQAAATEYELLRAGLGEHLRQLKDIQSIEAKIALKAEIIAEYDDHVDGVLAGASDDTRAAQDDIVVQTMIWAIDTGDAARALPRARFVIRHGQELPTRFERTAACLIAEEFAELALKKITIEGAVPVDLDVLLQVEQLTEAEDMHDQVRAKLNKAIGLTLARTTEESDGELGGKAGGRRARIAAALPRLTRALELDPKAGVKKEIAALSREAEALQPTE